MTNEIPSVRCAVAATAACHIANRLDDDHLVRQSLHLRLKATEFLRSELMAESSTPDLARLTCMLLLAQLDVCLESYAFIALTDGLNRSVLEIASNSEHTSRRQARLSNYVAQTMANEAISNSVSYGKYLLKPLIQVRFRLRATRLDVMDATTSLRMPYHSTTDIKAVLDRFRTPSGRREWGFDVFYCPIDLFEYIADITVLYKLPAHSPASHQDAMQKSIHLGRAIQSWDSPSERRARHHMIEVWRAGTLLYLIRLFHLSDSVFNTPRLTSSIIDHARAIPSRTGWRHSISWPLFQAGLFLSHAESQSKNWLRNEMYTNFRTLGCLHQKLAIEALEQIWSSSSNSPKGPFCVSMPQRNLIL
jgi:hypothetical protein